MIPIDQCRAGRFAACLCLLFVALLAAVGPARAGNGAYEAELPEALATAPAPGPRVLWAGAFPGP